jgi:hypothetical protein
MVSNNLYVLEINNYFIDIVQIGQNALNIQNINICKLLKVHLVCRLLKFL